jgi:GxxExxY protein
MVELQHQEIGYEYVKTLPIVYDGHRLGVHPARLINVEDKVLLATFAVRTLDDGMIGRLRARLRILGVRLGLLANFKRTTLRIVPVCVE